MAEEPVISTSGETLYQRVVPVMRYDEEEGWVGRYLCESLMAMLQNVDQIVLDTETHPGWCTILDPVTCPESWLNWCAQLYGVTLTPNISAVEKRRQIMELPPQKRGSLAAMRMAAEHTLTGKKEVLISEQAEGHSYRMIVTTQPSETPSAENTELAILSQKPGGIKLLYNDGVPLKWSATSKKWKDVGSTVKYGTIQTGQA